jgi:formate hydrogenlyase subunit 4
MQSSHAIAELLKLLAASLLLISFAMLSRRKLLAAGSALAAIEAVSAKLRIFRAPEYLATAFLLAALGLLVHLLLES